MRLRSPEWLASRSNLSNALAMLHSFGRPIAPQPKPGHQAEHYQHAEVHGARNLVAAGQIIGKRSMLQSKRKPKFRADCESKCQESGNQRAVLMLNLWEAFQYVSRGQEDGGCHDWHFSQFSPSLSDARNH